MRREFFLRLLSNQGSSKQSETLKLTTELKREEEIAISYTKHFFRAWWAGKIVTPSLEMFKMLNAKHSKDSIPFSMSDNGIQAQSPQENCQMIFNYFSNIFNEGGTPSHERSTCFDIVGRARTKFVHD